jgi:hypothetical protein
MLVYGWDMHQPYKRLERARNRSIFSLADLGRPGSVTLY